MIQTLIAQVSNHYGTYFSSFLPLCRSAAVFLFLTLTLLHFWWCFSLLNISIMFINNNNSNNQIIEQNIKQNPQKLLFSLKKTKFLLVKNEKFYLNNSFFF